MNIYEQNITQKFRKYKGVYTDFMLTLCGQNTNFCDAVTIYNYKKKVFEGVFSKKEKVGEKKVGHDCFSRVHFLAHFRFAKGLFYSVVFV